MMDSSPAPADLYLVAPPRRIAAHTLFLWLVPLLGLAYMILTPPFEIPDEPNHFFRAWQLSHCRISPETQGGDFGGQVPWSVVNAVHVILNVVPQRPEKLNVGDILVFLRAPLEPQKSRFVGFANTVVYIPSSYIPQTVGVGLARLCGGSPLALLYSGRLLTLIATLVLIYWAIRLTPVAPWVFCLAGLSPMMLTLAASFSVDAATIGYAFLLTALLLRQILDAERRLGRGEMALIAALGLVLSLSKIVYFPLVFLVWLIPRGKFGSARRALFYCSAVVLLCVGANLWWNARIKGYYLPMFAGVDFSRQTRLVLEHPLRFMAVMARTYLDAHRDNYLVECYGKMGYLTVPMPYWMALLYYGLLAAAALTATWAKGTKGTKGARGARGAIGAIGWWRRLAMGLVAAAVIGLVGVALYVTCTTVGRSTIEGLQGRYFIPVLPLCFVLLVNRRPGWAALGERLAPAWPPVVALFSILSAIVALWRVCGYYF